MICFILSQLEELKELMNLKDIDSGEYEVTLVGNQNFTWIFTFVGRAGEDGVWIT